MIMFAETPAPPYYAVIFTSLKTNTDSGYIEMANRMEALAKEQPGYLGIESARSEIGITVSYWKDLQSIKDWKQNTEHLYAQQKGREQWYSKYSIKICRVEKEYGFAS
jgi:heme-degrading monooxygenase HmoA